MFNSELHPVIKDDVVLPDQFNRSRFDVGHLRLMRAILFDACNVMRHGLTKPEWRKLPVYQDTVDWITSEEKEWIFSFEVICEVLGHDPGRLRQFLLSKVPRPSMWIK